jgi:hypothetical protein
VGGGRLGVDFGTSNTVAVLELTNREPRPLLVDGSPLLPSAVAADAGGRLVVGRDALRVATFDPGSFEPHPKRCIDDDTVLLGDRSVPVAAATYFDTVDTDLPVGGTAVVYDFGAGTFDASVIRRTATGFEVLASAGLGDCGGLDIDAAIVTGVGAALRERDGWARLMRPRSAVERRASRQFWDNVRQAKEMLSRSATTLIHVPLVEVEVPIGRERLDEAAAPVLARTVSAVRSALLMASVATPDAVFLCGGSSRMPAVTAVLHREFGFEPSVVDQPELAVAEGSVECPRSEAVAVTAGGVQPSRSEAAPAVDPSWPAVDLTKRPSDPPRRRFSGSWARVGAAAAVVVLAVAAMAAVVAFGDRSDGGRTPGGATTSAGFRSGTDPCVVGTWREATGIQLNNIQQIDVWFDLASGGQVATYRPDGTVFLVLDKVLTAMVDGVKWEHIVDGWANGRYTVAAGTVSYASWTTSGTWELRRNGRYNNGGALSLTYEPDSYVCDGDVLKLTASAAVSSLARVKT